MNYLKKELYNRIRHEDRIFEFIQNTTQDGLWYWDLEQPENEWMNPKFWGTLGYDPAEMPHKISAWKEIVNEKDLKVVEKSIEKHLSNPDSEFDEIIRYRHKNGHTVWIRCKGMAIRNEEGKPVRMLGAHTDITEQVRKEKFLERCNSAANIGYWELDVENECLYWSDTVKKIHDLPAGYKPKVDEAINFYLEGENRNAIKKALKKARENGSFYDLELQIKTAKNRKIWVRTLGYSEFFNGNCVRLYGSLQDIDEQKRAEKALKESIDQFETLVENIPGATYQYTVQKNGDDKFFKLEYLSGYVEEITGYRIEDFRDDNDLIIKKIIHEEDLSRVMEAVNQAVENKEGWQVEYRIRHKNGSTRWISERGNVFAMNGGERCKLIGVLFDQTGQVKVQEKLAKEKKILRTIIDNVPVNIYMKDKHRRKILANKSEVKYSGFDKEEDVLGKTDEELYPDDIADNYTREDNKVLKEGISLREMENDMGFGRWAIVSKIPVTDNEGSVESIVGISIDITQRKRAEMMLKKSEEQFRKTFENSANGMAILSLKGDYIKINKAYREILGYSQEELQSKTFKEVTHPEDLEKNALLIKQLIKGERDHYKMEKRYIHKSGKVVWAHLAASIIKDEVENKSYFISQITDITREKEAEEQLNEALNKLKSILAASTRVGIVSTDPEGMITSFNRGAENLLGYAADELVGKDSPLTFHLKKELKEKNKGLKNKTGKTDDEFEVLTRFVRQTKFETKVWELVRKDGSTFPAHLTITEIRGDSGKLEGYLGIVSDISELKQRENELKHLLEINKEQNERLLNFAHIVSHNLKGHASNFAMIMDLLEVENDPDEILQFVKMLRMASNNLDETVKNLTQVVEANTKPKEALKPVNIKLTIEKVMDSLGAIIKNANAEVQIEADTEAEVIAIPAYVESIFYNLVSNAVKYRSSGRKPKIRIKASSNKDYRVISVEDNGSGIDLEKHGDKLFGMYKTFHGNEDARGIGLFITKNQIEAMGGDIEVESEPGKGSVFRVYLPKPETNIRHESSYEEEFHEFG